MGTPLMVRIHYTDILYVTTQGSLSRAGSYAQTFGDKACHPERSEDLASLPPRSKARAQDDMPDPSQARSREPLSPNVYLT